MLDTVAVSTTVLPLATLFDTVANVTVELAKLVPPQPIIELTVTSAITTKGTNILRRRHANGAISRQTASSPAWPSETAGEVEAVVVPPRPVVWMVMVDEPPAVMVAGEAVIVKPPGSDPPLRVTVPVKPYNTGSVTVAVDVPPAVIVRAAVFVVMAKSAACTMTVRVVEVAA